MHISEGVLSTNVIATSAILLAPIIVNSVKKLHHNDIAKVALVAHLPLAIVEGVLMIFLFKTLQKYQIKGLSI